MLNKKNKGIGFLLGFFIISVFSFLAAALFMYFWQYNLKIYIISDARESKSSLIPLVLFSKTYSENENYLLKFNKAKLAGKLENKLDLEEIKENFVNEQKEVIEIYIVEYCFSIETDSFKRFDDFEDKKMWIWNLIPHQYISREYMCSRDSFYEKSYKIPIIFDGEKFIETFKFSCYELREDVIKKDIEREMTKE